ncbi:TIGR02679 family protein [Streptomyces sp. NBC_01429]|uniref:TIGR02679 family protein n=1 Tax=Streptomyces sp. NBC_01429 TaxID=2903862 RepID=UPI002E2CEF06|nr:TIGR02679 family protein [Streptomyces sp. NBC_01429]
MSTAPDGTTPAPASPEGTPPASARALPDGTRAWLAGPGLARLWEAARARLERNGLRATGSLRLTELGAQERTALSQLVGNGKVLTGTTATVGLAALDTRLRASAAGLGLVETLGALGPPLTDRRAVRADADARRARIWSSVASALDASPLAGEVWAREWYEGLRRAGVPAGVEPDTATRTLLQAVRLLTVLLAPAEAVPATAAPKAALPEQSGAGPARDPRTARTSPGTRTSRGRGELAAEATGSAHGLDDGTWLSRLVQRGIALAHGAALPDSAAERRALWRLAGVAPDEISSTVLAYGLRPEGGGWREQALRERAVHHAEAQLTLRELRALRLSLPAGTLVRICENPRVVEAAADAGCGRPLVCTSGSATTAVLTLLDALAATGCRFAYHGDFDWPGIALANRIMRRYDARPWRLLAGDYELLAARAAERGIPPLPLAGPRVGAEWDPDLAPAMSAHGVALHEEATLEPLVNDLKWL